MKIAVPYEDGKVFQHFGRAREIKLYTVENGAVTAAHLVANEAEGHGAVTRLLKELGVNIVICGNIGGCAQKAVRENGIPFRPIHLRTRVPDTFHQPNHP